VFKDSIAKFLKLDQVMERLTDYVESRIEILKYDLKEDLSKIISKLSVFLILVFAFTFFLFFFSMALAFSLTRYVGMFGGFSIVSGVYVIVGIILFLQRKPLADWIEREISIMIKQKKK
jgi:hypothetical protein